MYRADNLAAFGVGHGIAKDIQASETWQKIDKAVKRGEAIKLTDEEKKAFVKDIQKSMEKLFSNPQALARRTNKYHGILDKVVGGTNTIGPNALFFVPEYRGGFNTDSLDTTLSKVYDDPLTSGGYYDKVIRPAFERRKDKSVKLDDWLKAEFENYKIYTPFPK